MQRTALIDGDELAYCAAFSTQSNYYSVTKDGVELWRHTRKKETIEYIGNHDFKMSSKQELLGVDPGYARARLWMREVLEALKTDKYRIFFNGANNFRYKLATITPYKGNRDEASKPKLLPNMKEFITNTWGSESIDTLESDDCLSVYQEDDSTVIVTQDKDLNMVPGWRWNTRNRKLSKISVEEGRHSFYEQLIMGDATDCIPGLSGVGPVRANNILKGCATEAEYYHAVLDAYIKHIKAGKNKWESDLSVREMLWEIGNLLWMRREPNKTWEAPIR